MKVKPCDYVKDKDDLNPFPLVEDCKEDNCADVNGEEIEEIEIESDKEDYDTDSDEPEAVNEAE